MLCRALLAAVVLSYVLCVLFLSGVQKEDIDAGTLRKLQRHNVNIDDINDQKLRKQCLGKTNIPVTTLTQDNPVTKKPLPEKSVTAKEMSIEKDNVGAEDRTKLQKIFDYLEYNRKGTLKSKDNALNLRPALNSKLQSSSSLRSRVQNINVEDTSSETSELRGTSVVEKEDEKTNKATMNKKLENLMNIWQTDIDRITSTTRQETTTVKVVDDTLSKNTKDVEYITKIVEEILSTKKKTDLKTVTSDSKSTYYNTNATFRDADQTSGPKSRDKANASANYFLNNCKLGNFYESNKENLDNYKRESSGIKVPVTDPNNDGYIICKRVEAKEKQMLTDRMRNNILYNILNKLQQESEKFKQSDNGSAIRTPFENQPKTANVYQRKDEVQTSKTYEKGLSVLDNEINTALKNQSKSIFYNKQGELMKTWDTYKDGFDMIDVETARALEAALEIQSNIYNKIFNRQRDLVRMSNADKGRIQVLDSERRKELQSALNQNLENKDYNMWQIQTETEPIENIVIKNIHKQKPNNIPNNIEYDPRLGYQNKRPWFFSEVSSGQWRTKNKNKLKGVFFQPNDNKKTFNSESRSKSTIRKEWSPYFDILDKKSSIIEPDEIETPKSKKSILVDSYGIIQIHNKEISEEQRDNSKKHSNIVELYQNKNGPPNTIKEQSNEQFETKKDKKTRQSNCRNTIECQSDAEYKSNWAYLRNNQIKKQTTNRKPHSQENEYSNYQFPSRPRPNKSRYETYIAEKELIERNETKDSIQFPQNVIKDLANSIKEFVLRDLITTTIKPPTTTTPSTTTLLSITKITTTTISTTTTTTIKPIEGTSTAETKQPFKIQDASNALVKIMEMFEKISSFKDKIVKHENVTNKEKIHYDTKIEATTKTIQPVQETENRLTYDPQSSKPNVENQTPYVQQPFQQNPDNRIPNQQQPLQYIPQAVQMRPENGTPYVLPAMQLRGEVVVPLQSNPETRTLYFPPAVQLAARNRLAYDPQPLQSNSENLRPYFLHLQNNKSENSLRYVPQAAQMKTQNRTPYVPQAVQMKAEKENHFPYEASQSKIENRSPYLQVPSQMQENRIPYFPQSVQSKAENRVPYDSQPLQRSPENRIPYDQQPMQSNLGNRIPYDPQPLQSNPDNRAPYLQQPSQYAPNSVKLKSENRVSYDQLLQSGPKNIYGNKNPYYNSKIELDPYQEKEVLEPIKQKPKPRKYAITVQTNSGEIAPLKIEVKKPVLQTIVLTTKSPAKVEQHSDETFRGRKPKPISTRQHHLDKPEGSERSNNGENNQYSFRQTHSDAYIDHPKSRKIKKEREINQQYKPRDLHEIERFHEKLERGDAWSQYEEENIAKRMQRPIIKNTNYDDTHFRNFLQTQQKVNAMLERILATSKKKAISTEVM